MCEVANVGRSTHYRWLQQDPEYRKAVDIAKEEAADNLEAEAYRRAVEGVEKPVGWYKGKPGGYAREYSDVLLMFLLKAQPPIVTPNVTRLRKQMAGRENSAP